MKKQSISRYFTISNIYNFVYFVTEILCRKLVWNSRVVLQLLFYTIYSYKIK